MSSFNQDLYLDPASPLAYEEEAIARLPAVIVVDPLSTGTVLAYHAHKRGLRVVAVYSDHINDDLMSFVPKWCKEGGLTMDGIKHTGDVEATANRVKKLEHLDIRRVIAGCESGVSLQDELARALHLPHGNDPATSNLRTDKYSMGERVREAGLRGVKQQLVTRVEELAPFMATLGRNPRMILKPVQSAGSDQVHLVTNLEEARAAFESIMSSRTIFGCSNDAVLAQEYLCGQEYVVDCVSHNGEHKVVALWAYEKRPFNGAPFVYFGMRLLQTHDGAKERRLAEYVWDVLDALGVRNGPSHSEVIWIADEDAPCLVETGARPHGGEGAWLKMTDAPIGYNQVSVTLDLLEDPAPARAFKALPKLPGPMKAWSVEVCLVSSQEGIITGLNKAGWDEVRSLPSFLSIELAVGVGDKLKKTVDLLSSPGSVLLGHHDKEVLERDFARVHELERSELFVVDGPAV